MKDDELYLEHLRHSCSHLLAAAVLELWPNAKPTLGPATEGGFYYDFDFGDIKISEEDFPKIEQKMHDLVKSWKSFEKVEVTKEEVLSEFENNEYKKDLIEEHSKDGEKLTVYQSGNFRDLCRGGHIENPSENLRFFKLLSVAGAYWRGDEKNKMLTRIYGTAFSTQKELDEYLESLEQAKLNDHRKLGKELDLFCFSDLVGPGLVMWTPKGTIIKNELYKYVVEVNKKYGAQEVSIPHMARIELYETSGHAQKFKDELFKVVSHYDIEFVLKPVNCPHHTQIYASRPRSYKDLPIRYIESTQQHRDEKPGEIGGLQRTRSFEVDDGHTFCTPSQIKQEAINIAKIVEEFYKTLGLWDGHWVSLSVRDPKTPEKYIGDDADWKIAEKMIKEVSDELGLDGRVMEGEAALYGPKIDFMRQEAGGKKTQLATIQIDFAMPKRFGLEYTDENGEQRTPVMLHRAILGSYQRFIMALIERFGGNFPTWLSPVQVKILPITERHMSYALSVMEKLKENGIRVELDDRNERLQAKIRDAQNEKVSYMLIIGDKEVETNTVTERARSGKADGPFPIETFIGYIRKEIDEKIIN
jgi:threonyl-tRNA synthetase